MPPMDKQKAEKPSRAVAPSTPEVQEENTLEQAKAAFKAALDKTRKTVEAELPDEPKEEASVEPAPKKAKAKAKPEPKSEDLSAKVAELEQRLAEAQKAKEPAPKPEPKKSQLEEVREYLAKEFGEDEAETLTRAFGSVLEPMMKRTEQLESLLQEASKRGREQAAKSNLTRITKQFPHLKENKAALEMVKAQAELLAEREPTKFGNPEEVYDHVAETLFGGMSQREEEESEDDDAEEVERIKASTVSDAGRAKKERKLTPDERAWAVFEHLTKDPDDLAGAKKVARQTKAN